MSIGRNYGPNASVNFANLDEERQRLFVWFTDKMIEDGLKYGSLLQAVACQAPQITYWDAVGLVRIIVEQPNFKVLLATATAEARISIQTPPEA